MKKITLLLLLLSLTQLYAKEYLAVVPNLNDHAPQFHTIEQVGNTFILLADETDRAKLQALNLSVQIVDRDPQSKEYLLISPEQDRAFFDKEQLNEACDVLADLGHSLLVRGTAVELHKNIDFSMALNRLDFTPMRFASPQPRTPLTMPGEANPLIKSMVEKISLDTLRTNVKTLQDFHTRYATSMQNSDEVCPWLKQKLIDLGCDTVYYQEFSHRYGPNVVGVKKGTVDSSLTTYCAIGGHLDSYSKANPLGYSPGADDNASGTSSVLEAARVMKNYTFEHTIKFILWNAEEVGLEGSEALAQKATNEGHTIIGGLINFDMIGRTTAEHDYLQVTGPSDIPGGQEIVDIFATNAELYTNLKFQTTVNNTSTASDHASYWRQNFLALYGIQSARKTNEVMHTAKDTLDNPEGYNDSPFHTEVTKAGIATLAHFAKVTGGDTKLLSLTQTKGFNVEYANKAISISLPEVVTEAVTVKICNLLGQVVFTKSLQSPKTNVTIPIEKSSMSSGVYIAEISTPAFSQQVKFFTR